MKTCAHGNRAGGRELPAAALQVQPESRKLIVQWNSMSETPAVGTKIVALMNDGSGSCMFFVHDHGFIDCEGNDCSRISDSYEAWAYIPPSYRFWCEDSGEDSYDLPVEEPPSVQESGSKASAVSEPVNHTSSEAVNPNPGTLEAQNQ